VFDGLMTIVRRHTFLGLDSPGCRNPYDMDMAVFYITYGCSSERLLSVDRPGCAWAESAPQEMSETEVERAVVRLY